MYSALSLTRVVTEWFSALKRHYYHLFLFSGSSVQWTLIFAPTVHREVFLQNLTRYNLYIIIHIILVFNSFQTRLCRLGKVFFKRPTEFSKNMASVSSCLLA